MDLLAPLLAALAGLVVARFANRAIAAEPGYLIVDPADLPEGADPSALDALAPAPTVAPVALATVVRPGRRDHAWYPAVEVASMAVAALAAARYGLGTVGITVGVGALAATTLAAVDLRVMRIPDRINGPATLVAAGAIVATSIAQGYPGAIVGAAAGAVGFTGLLFVAHLVSPRGMGFGDVKLAGLLGLYLGWFGWTDGSVGTQVEGIVRFVLLGLGAGSLIGVVTGAGYAIARRDARRVFPFGPSLVAGALVVVFFASAFR